jgi:hypothetical protein
VPNRRTLLESDTVGRDLRGGTEETPKLRGGAERTGEEQDLPFVHPFVVGRMSGRIA